MPAAKKNPQCGLASKTGDSMSGQLPTRAGEKGDGALTVRGYMCLADWEYEIGHAGGGNKVYASLHDHQEHHSSWKECGVIEVEVRIVRLVVPADRSAAIARMNETARHFEPGASHDEVCAIEASEAV